MDNINQKTVYGVLVCIGVLFIGYLIYSYIQQHIDKKISKEKKKLKKSYEQQFNQMFYNQNGDNANINYIDPNDQDREREYYDPERERDLNSQYTDNPSGIESDAASSHSETMENGQLRDIRILDDNYRSASKSGTGKRCRG